MMSQDTVIIVEAFNARFDSLEKRLDGQISQLSQRIDGLTTEIRVLDREMAVNTAKVEMLQHTFYWGLAIIAIAAALAPLFRREKSENPKPAITRSDVQSMIDEAISRALGAKK